MVSAVVFVACTKEDYIEGIELPRETAVMDASRYAVVMEPYVMFRDVPKDDGITSSHARAGEVFEVQAINLDMTSGEQVVWVLLKGAGWILATHLRLYPTEEKARAASRRLK